MEAPRGVKLTGTNKPCGLTIFSFVHLRARAARVAGSRSARASARATVVDGSYRLQDIQLFRFFDIVWDDRQRDEAWLLAAFRAVGPQAASFLAKRLTPFR